MLYRAKDMSNPWSDLEARPGGYSESKRLEAGEELRGFLVDIGLGADGYGGLYRVCTIECPEDRSQHILWLYHQDLRRQFRARKPFLGDQLTLRRLENAGRRARYRLTVNQLRAAVAQPAARGS